MNTIPVNIKLLRDGVRLPSYAHSGDAGMDVYAPTEIFLGLGTPTRIPLGFSLEFPPSHVAILKDKSSLAVEGIHVLGGVCDATYRGEYSLVLINFGRPMRIQAGCKIAQILFVPFSSATLALTDELSASERVGGFGSTGK